LPPGQLAIGPRIRYVCPVNPRVFIATTALGFAGCAGTPAPGFSEARSAELAKAQIFQAFAEPCSLDAPLNAALPPDAPQPPATVQPEPGSFTSKIFLETALFLLPTARANLPLPASRESLTRAPDVRLLGTPHLVVASEATARAALEDHLGPLAEVALREITATPRQTADARLAIELETVLLLPTQQTPTGRPRESRIRFFAVPHPGQAMAVTEQIPEQPGQSLLLLLTPYAIRRESDLRAIFLCKMAQRQRALARTR
jgi:hypothetical protein